MFELTAADRQELERISRSSRLPQGLATRAGLVLQSAEYGCAEAARRSGVTPKTALKWVQRFHALGIAGLHDSERPGRPPVSDETLARVLGCALVEPPNDAQRWSTRLIAEHTGVSQATVSRVRREFYPQLDSASSLFVDNTSFSLGYIDSFRGACALGFHAVPKMARSIPRAARADIVESILCAALLTGTAPPTKPVAERGEHAEAVEAPASTSGSLSLTLLRRAKERVPPNSAMSIMVNVEMDAAARNWLEWHPNISAISLVDKSWFNSRHRIVETIDQSRFDELREVQQRLRAARLENAQQFTWVRGRFLSLDDGLAKNASARWTATSANRGESRIDDARSHSGPRPGSISAAADTASHSEVELLVRALCDELSAGRIRVEQPITIKTIAERSGSTPRRTSDCLAHLAAESLVAKKGSRFHVPAPRTADVIETYTARGLLGTVLVRRLASERRDLPASVNARIRSLEVCAAQDLVVDAGVIDLDLQDEIARAASLPRIGSMFVGLTQQVRLFIAALGLNYRYPVDEILADDRMIINSIRHEPPEAAVAAWRCKVNNCIEYMLAHL